VLNRVGSERHASQARTAIEATGLGVLGALPRDATLALPERHLGLVQAHEHDALAAHLARLAEAMARHVDLDAIAAIATALPGARPASVSTALPGAGPAPVALRPPGQRIALAEDAAFSFTYPHVLEGWRKGGASIHPFSPLADEAPPDGCDAAWLPGGYPELHAGALAAARNFQDGLRRFAATKPVHGECGGFMVLGTGLEDADGTRHAMTGLLGHATSFARRRLALGYREATLLEDGRVLRGHEFHYATISEPGNDAPWASFADATGKVLGPAGARRGLVSGSFFHAIAEAD